MRYRLIAIDLDGTLLDPDKQITVQTRAAIARAMETGVIVVPATGRAWHMAHDIALQHLPSLACGVFLDGTTVCNPVTGCVEISQCMDADALHDLHRTVHTLPVTWDVCRLTPAGDDYDYAIFGRGPIAETLAAWDRHRIGRSRLSGDKQFNGQPCLVTWLRTHEKAALDEIEQRIAQRRLPLCTIRWTNVGPDAARGKYVLQLHADTANKWQALRAVARRHGIRPEQIAAIGDEINDVTMVREAGCGVAMGNAIEPVKAVADRIAPANRDNGVAYAIERLLTGVW